MSFFPEVKKKLSSFIQDEKGSIQKQSLLSLGTILSASTFLGLMSAEAGAWHSNSYCNNHSNNMKLLYDETTSRITATHKHSDTNSNNYHNSS